MAIKTNIQWCDSTVNPIMGCGGCELYPKPGDLLKAVDAELHSTIDRWRNGKSRQIFRALIDNAWKKLIKALGEPLPGHTNKMTTTNIWHLREQFADQVVQQHSFG